MNSPHLTPETLAGWRRQPDAVRHLGECATCRELVNIVEGIGRLESALSGAEEHPGYNDLEALVDGEADPVTHDLLLRHLAKCETCAEEYRDLAAFRADLQSTARTPRRLRLVLPAAAAMAAAVLIMLVIGRGTRPKPAAPLLTTSLRDAGTTVGLNAAGAFQGLDQISAADRESLRQVLQSLTLPVSADAAKLKRTREVQLGGASGLPPSFEAISPTGTVVPNPNPAFHWDAPAGARNFVVAVYTNDFDPVTKSRTLTRADWTPDQPLAEGRTYVWTVSAQIDGKRVTVPKAPEPEAIFRVATSAERAQLESARLAAPGSALLEATVASRLGMVDVARLALAKLEAANPGNPVAASLSRKLAPTTTNTK